MILELPSVYEATRTYFDLLETFHGEIEVTLFGINGRHFLAYAGN